MKLRPDGFGIIDLCQCGVLVTSCLSDSELVSVVRLNVESILGAASGGWGVELSLHAIDVSQAFMNSITRGLSFAFR